MARTPPDPSQLIARLTAAKKLVKPGEILNLEEMATAAGITARHLKPQIDDDPEWPIVQRGSEGVPWQLDGRAVIAHMVRRAKEKLALRDTQRKRLARLAGLEVETTGDAPSLAEMREADRLQQSLHRRKIEQGEYVPRTQVYGLVVDLLSLFQTETMATRAALDPGGLWPTDVADAVDDRMRETLIRVHDRAEEFVPKDARQ